MIRMKKILKSPFSPLFLLLFILNACQMGTIPAALSPPGSRTQPEHKALPPPSSGTQLAPKVVPPSPNGDFSIQSLTVNPPTPIPLPSGNPTTCGFTSTTDGNYLANIQAHYEIYTRYGTQENTADTQTGNGNLHLNVDSGGNLDIGVDFSTQGPTGFLGDFHNFGGRLSVAPHSTDQDFSFGGSGFGGYSFLISRWDYSISYSFDVPSVSVSGNYVAATRTLTVTVSGSSNTVSEGTRYAYNISGGASNFTGTASFVLPECPDSPNINLLVDPPKVTSAGPSQINGSSVGVRVNKKTTPWQVAVTSPEGSTCDQPQQSGSDNTNSVFPFDASHLGNGIYNLKAYYPSIPNVSAENTIEVALPVAVTPDKAVFNPRKKEQINFNIQAPPCPRWDLKLTGTGITETGDSVDCSKAFQGDGDQKVTWDGTCQPSSGTSSGKTIAAGDWLATLKSGSQSAEAVVTADNKFREKFKLTGYPGMMSSSGTLRSIQSPLTQGDPQQDEQAALNETSGDFTVQANPVPNGAFFKGQGVQRIAASPDSRYHLEAFVEVASKRPRRNIAFVTIRNKDTGKVYFEEFFSYLPYVPKTQNYTWDLRNDLDSNEFAPLGPYEATLTLDYPYPKGEQVDQVDFEIVGTAHILAGSYMKSKGGLRSPVPGVVFHAQPLDYQKSAIGGDSSCVTTDAGTGLDKAYCLMSGLPVSRVRVSALFGTQVLSRIYNLNRFSTLTVYAFIDQSGQMHLIGLEDGT